MSGHRRPFTFHPGGQMPPGLIGRSQLPHGGSGSGAGPGSSGGSEAPAVSRSLQVYPPELYPIIGAQEFDVNADFATAGAGTLTPAALRLKIPDRFVAVIRWFGFGLQNMVVTTDITFSLRINQAVVPGYALRFFPGAAPRVTGGKESFVRVPIGATLDVLVTQVDAGAYTANANFAGWFWEEEAGRRWTGEGR